MARVGRDGVIVDSEARNAPALGTGAESEYNRRVSEDYSQFVAAHRERRLLDQQRATECAERAWEAARAAADRLVSRLEVTGVILFGSLARDVFTTHSDIDLAVEGLRPGMLVDAQAVAEDNCPFKSSTFFRSTVPDPTLRARFAARGLSCGRADSFRRSSTER